LHFAPGEVLAQARRENFPVALRWLAPELRRDLLAVYGFARLADDLGDEAPGDRLARLDALEAELDRAIEGRATHPLLRELTPALRRGLPRQPFLRLIEANRRDQRETRMASFEALLDYCRLSANPVGELVLGIFGAACPENIALSDAICSALQVVEHLQDVAEDAARGRVYLPADDLARLGCRDAELRRAPASPALRCVVARQARRARALLAQGEPLVANLRGGARVSVAAFAAGGHAALDAIEHADFDVVSAVRRPSRMGVLRHAVALVWRARGRRP
jgi:squalene synthase HpnC